MTRSFWRDCFPKEERLQAAAWGIGLFALCFFGALWATR